MDLPSNIQTANRAWIQLLHGILHLGRPVVVDSSNPSGASTIECPASQSFFDMQYPLLTARARKLSYKFACAEAWWILTGQNSVEAIAKYNPKMREFSDDQFTLWGAYGPRIMEQWEYVAHELHRDPASRRAVIEIWRPNPAATRDYPCTLSIQVLIRGKKLHIIDTMRSSDAWLGWPYDVFSFSMVAGWLILKLREKYGMTVDIGSFTLNAGSQHLYERDRGKALAVFDPSIEPIQFGYRPFNPLAFKGPGELEEHLKQLADGLTPTYSWLQEYPLENWKN